MKKRLNQLLEKENRKGYVLFKAKVIDEVEIGYYDLKVVTNKQEYKAMFAVAPKRCYELDKKGKEKIKQGIKIAEFTNTFSFSIMIKPTDLTGDTNV